MIQSIIVLGDQTSHGGRVISASDCSDTDGKGWARVGDMVSCPRCKGVFPILQGDASLIDAGRAVAYHGCKVGCGATLISSQLLTSTQPSGGAAPSAGIDDSPAGWGAIGADKVASYQEELLDEASQRFRGRFQVVDIVSGKPVTGESIRLRSTGGQYVTGTLNADGFTQWVERDASESIAFDMIGKGQG